MNRIEEKQVLKRSKQKIRQTDTGVPVSENYTLLDSITKQNFNLQRNKTKR